MDAILRRHLSQPGFSLNGHLRGVVDEGETEIVSVDIFYSFDDQVDMTPQFAGTTQPGSFSMSRSTCINARSAFRPRHDRDRSETRPGPQRSHADGLHADAAGPFGRDERRVAL
jgi:hypothetical protein